MEVYRAQHDWLGDESVASTIAETIAAIEGTDPTELESLNGVVDTDALDKVFRQLDGAGARATDGWVQFPFDGHQVAVAASGEVTVRPSATSGPDEEVSDGAEFQSLLSRLIRRAEANGVDVDGGWACRAEADLPEWGIEIYEVERLDASSDVASRN